MKLINQEDKAAAERAGYRKRIMLMAFVLALCCFFTVINIQVQNIFEFDYRKSEFELLQIIGMSKRKKYIMIALETAYIFLLGLIIGLASCMLLQRILYGFSLINHPQVEMNFIMPSVAVIGLFMMGSMFLACKKI